MQQRHEQATVRDLAPSGQRLFVQARVGACASDADVVLCFGEHATPPGIISGQQARRHRDARPRSTVNAVPVDRVGRAGMPTAIVCGGMSWVTSPPPPTIEYSPIFVSGNIVAPMPSC